MSSNVLHGASPSDGLHEVSMNIASQGPSPSPLECVFVSMNRVATLSFSGACAGSLVATVMSITEVAVGANGACI